MYKPYGHTGYLKRKNKSIPTHLMFFPCNLNKNFEKSFLIVRPYVPSKSQTNLLDRDWYLAPWSTLFYRTSLVFAYLAVDTVRAGFTVFFCYDLTVTTVVIFFVFIFATLLSISCVAVATDLFAKNNYARPNSTIAFFVRFIRITDYYRVCGPRRPPLIQKLRCQICYEVCHRLRQ